MKALRVRACSLWLLALIVLTNAFVFMSLGVWPALCGWGLSGPIPGRSQLHSWSSCLDDFLIQEPDFESTGKRGECPMTANAEQMSNMYQLLGSAHVHDPHHYPAHSTDKQPVAPRGEVTVPRPHSQKRPSVASNPGTWF